MKRLRRATRPLRHGLAWGVLQGLAGALRLLPLPLALGLGALLGRLVGQVAVADRRRVRGALAACLEHPPSVGACFADLGRRVAELINARRMLALVVVDPAALACWEAARAAGRGVLVATLHLGNWELMAAALAAHGVPVVAVGARRQAGPLFRWLARLRADLGVQVLGPGQGRAALRTLQAGETVAFFVDQATRERSRWVPFFGRPAPVPETLERLQQASGAPVLLVWSVRRGRTHTVHAEAIPGARPLDVITARAEALVRADPTQWVWQHARWTGPQRAAPRRRNAGIAERLQRR